MSGSSKAWTWRHAFASSGLPATTKAVLHTLGMFMNELGEGCYPSIADICRYSGLDKKTVMKHLATARDAGWIAVSQHGYRGQRWKRQEYAARWPERDLLSSCPPADDEKGGGNNPPPSQATDVVDFVPEGGGNEGAKVVEHVHQDKTSPVNIPNNSPSERAREQEISKNGDNQSTAAPEDNPKTAAFEKRVLKFVEGEGYTAGVWKGWKSSSLTWIKARFADLSIPERLEAERWRDAYLLDMVSQKSNPQPVGVFLRDRTWLHLDEILLKRAESASSVQKKPDGWAACLGPVGMARLFAFLIDGPADSEHSNGSFLTDDMLRKAWPAVHGFKSLIQMKGGTVFGERWRNLAQLFEPVPQDTQTLSLWKEEFKARGWPWLSAFDGAPVVYCPRGGPDGLYDFEKALRGLGENDGN